MSAFFSAAVDQARRIIARINLLDLPSAPIDRASFGKNLPGVPAVYFVFGKGKTPLYIGKATNLRSRWSESFMVGPHPKLNYSLNLKHAVLRWLEMPKDEISIAEIMLIQHYAPKWNSHESPKPARLPSCPPDNRYRMTADDYRREGF
jgi:hypothetical protein